MSGSTLWWESAFTKPLLQAGFKSAGNYTFNNWGMVVPENLDSQSDIFVTVDLPSRANIQTQQGILSQYLHHLYLMRPEPMTLVGHSAGGVVARLYAIDPKHRPLNGLITIASPHLGTPTANIASIAGNSPIGIMASMAGIGALRDSRGLFSDLAEVTRDNFLGWMNAQPHPDIHYASIIRKNRSITRPNNFDFIVPAYSQDMNNVWALKHRSGIALSTNNHSLSIQDGRLVSEILTHIE